MRTKQVILVIILSLVFGFIGAWGAIWVSHNTETADARRANTYEDEMATFVSPTTVKEMIDKKSKNYILVDLRSKAEYDKEHIVTAINIPAVSMDTDQLVAAFRKLPKDKQIIVHCYSSSCTLGRHVGQVLSEHGVFVQEMDVGWNEWRYHWDLWNPGAGPLDGLKYIATGPAALHANPLVAPCTKGQFGC